jgi:hypothetical protein
MRLRSAKNVFPAPIIIGNSVEKKRVQLSSRSNNPSIAATPPMVSKPTTAAVLFATQNGSMAAAKIKNVHPPWLMGWKTSPSKIIPPMWTKTFGFSNANKPK